jgi:hypothetical protein
MDEVARVSEMIFGDPPSFDHILDVLAEVERTTNERR